MFGFPFWANPCDTAKQNVHVSIENRTIMLSTVSTQLSYANNILRTKKCIELTITAWCVSCIVKCNQKTRQQQQKTVDMFMIWEHSRYSGRNNKNIASWNTLQLKQQTHTQNYPWRIIVARYYNENRIYSHIQLRIQTLSINPEKTANGDWYD